MTKFEYTGFRDQLYSKWHRAESIGRFMSANDAGALAMIDLDYTIWVEYNQDSRAPVVLIETTEMPLDAWHQGDEPTEYYKKALVKLKRQGTVLKRLANGLKIPAFIVMYLRDPDDEDDILEFRVQQIAPLPGPWRTMSPQEYCRLLLTARKFASKVIWRTDGRDQVLPDVSGG